MAGELPGVEDMMLPVLRSMQGGERASKDIASATADHFGLDAATREERVAGSGQTVLSNRVFWAFVWGTKAGIVEKVRKGVYALSDQGRAELANPPPKMTVEYLRKYPGFAHAARRTAPRQVAGALAPLAAEPTPVPPLERIAVAASELEAALTEDLLGRVRKMDPTAFEQLMVDLLVKMGYGGSRTDAARRLGASGDGGIDGVIREDALGLDAVYVQAKRYAADNTVGSGAIREFAGALLTRGATKGVFVTTSSFSNAAKEEARQLASHKRVVLIDGDELARLMVEHDIGVRTVQTVRMQRLDLEAYENEGAV